MQEEAFAGKTFAGKNFCGKKLSHKRTTEEGEKRKVLKKQTKDNFKLCYLC